MILKLFKYLPSKYLDLVLKEGVFLFRTLSYFQDYEDAQVRGDKNEGVLRYSGLDGLLVNNLTTGHSFKAPWIFKSKVDSEKIFIFSLSKKLCSDLAREFGADACIEFEKPALVISKLITAVHIRKSIKPNRLFHGEVKYYTEQEGPNIDWALPSTIAMRKLACFSRQEEYRFVFSHDNFLKIGKTNQEVEIPSSKREVEIPSSNSKPERENYPEVSLKIGNIKKYCQVHKFS